MYEAGISTQALRLALDPKSANLFGVDDTADETLRLALDPKSANLATANVRLKT